MSEPQTESGLKPIAFAPEVLARIAPELSLQRHLAVGLRPSLRNLNEFRAVEVTDGGLSRATASKSDSPVLGSAVVKAGNTTVICGITAGLVEETLSETAAEEATSVYPVVEIARGRMGAPTDEEMILSQKLHETLHHAAVLKKEALKVTVGIRSQHADGTHEVFYADKDASDDDNMFQPSRQWSFVLYAHIQVLSREGPMFDLCWGALVKALEATRLPFAYIDERIADIKVPIRSRGHFGTVRENYRLTCDNQRTEPLRLSGPCGWSSSFGVVDFCSDEVSEDVDMVKDTSAVLLADLQGEAEEANIASRIGVVAAGPLLRNVSIVGGGAEITKQFLKLAIEVSRARAADLC